MTSARKEGKEVGRAYFKEIMEKSRGDNPHRLGSTNAYQWERGWLLALGYACRAKESEVPRPIWSPRYSS